MTLDRKILHHELQHLLLKIKVSVEARSVQRVELVHQLEGADIVDEDFPREGGYQERVFELQLLDVDLEGDFTHDLVYVAIDHLHLIRGERVLVVLDEVVPLRQGSNHIE